MPKYRAYAVVHSSKYLGEFEAASREEAEQMAWESDEAYVSLCHQCAREINDPDIVDIELEEVEE